MHAAPAPPVQEGIVHRSLKGDPLKFLTSLRRLDYKHHVYDKIKDSRTRMVAARCLEKERSELMHGEYRDDKEGTIARRQKRHRREGWFMTTHLYQKDIREVAPDNNGVERVNRSWRCGATGAGTGPLDANSVLFTVMATDWINGKSLYGSASGDGACRPHPYVAGWFAHGFPPGYFKKQNGYI